jgi:translation initiation factor 2A
VDNGVRIWHAGGPLMYNEDFPELYHVCWRPQPTSVHPLPANPFSPMPAPHASAGQYHATKKTPSKPVGAYRPPGARGQVTPLSFKREDEGGAAFVRDDPSSFSHHANGFGKGRPRVVPGADPVEDRQPLPPGAAPGGGVSLTGTGEGADEQMSKAARKNAKKREAKKAAAAAAKEQHLNNALTPEASAARNRSRSRSGSWSPNRGGQGQGGHQRSRSKGYIPAPGPDGKTDRSRSNSRRQRGESQVNGLPHRPHQNNNSNNKSRAPPQQPPTIDTKPPPPPVPESAPPEIDITLPTPTTPGANSTEKKVRGLLKKIRAIDDLKMRLAGGEKLEDTQMRKIHSEESVRAELRGLGHA